MQQIKINTGFQMMQVSPRWIALIQFVQVHPFVMFEKLRFEHAEPFLGEVDLKVKESIKF
jgi:hypothetical protein